MKLNTTQRTVKNSRKKNLKKKRNRVIHIINRVISQEIVARKIQI